MAATIQPNSHTNLQQRRIMQHPEDQELASAVSSDGQQQLLLQGAIVRQDAIQPDTQEHRETLHSHQPITHHLQNTSATLERQNPFSILSSENSLRTSELPSVEGAQAFVGFGSRHERRDVNGSVLHHRLPLSLAPEKPLLDPQSHSAGINLHRHPEGLPLGSGSSGRPHRIASTLLEPVSSMVNYQPTPRSRGKLEHILLGSDDPSRTRNNPHLPPVATQTQQHEFINNERHQPNVYYHVSQPDIPHSATYRGQPITNVDPGFNSVQAGCPADVSQYHTISAQGQFVETHDAYKSNGTLRTSSLPGMQHHVIPDQVNNLSLSQAPTQPNDYQTVHMEQHRPFHIAQQEQPLIPQVHYAQRTEETSLFPESSNIIRPSLRNAHPQNIGDDVAMLVVQPEAFVPELGSQRQMTGYAAPQLVPLGDTRQVHPAAAHANIIPGAPLDTGVVQLSQSQGLRFESSVMNPSPSVQVGQSFDGQSYMVGLPVQRSIRTLDCTTNLGGMHTQAIGFRSTTANLGVPAQVALTLAAPIMSDQVASIEVSHAPNPVLNYAEQPADPSHAYVDFRQNMGNTMVQQHGVVEQPVAHINGFIGQAPSYPHSTLIQSNLPPAVQTYENQMTIGYTYRSVGRHDLAIEAFRSAACVKPDSSEARSCFALACHDQGLYETAIIEFEVALNLGPMFPDDVYNNMGNTYRSMGLSRQAEVAYQTALNLSPQHAHAWNNLGNAIRAQGKFEEAMRCYSASLSAQPGFAPAHCNLAGLLRDQGKPQQAETQYRSALLSDPNLAEAAAGLGTALRDMGRADEAIGYYIRAVRLQPTGADHHANLANTYKDLNQIENSIVSYQSALDLQPDMPDAFCNMVHSLSVICDWRNRKENFIALISIIDKQLDALLRHPSTHPRLYNTLIGALTNSTPQLVHVNGGSRSEREGSVLSRGEDSTDRNRRRTRMRHPSSPMSFRSSGSSQRNGDTSVNPPSTVTYPSSSRKTTFSAAEHAVVAPVIATGLPSVQPFHALIYPMAPEKFKALSAAYASRAELLVQGIPRIQQLWLPPRRNGGILKVGYVSSDYNNHPYSHLTQSVYGLHRGGNVECFCYALTPSDNSAWRHRIETEAQNFRDISGMNAQMSAQAIANDGIHVLVNCNGYTKGARTELFALRPAPVQVSFMGFAGTLGAHYIEYFITDTVTSPPELASRMHSESLLYHPHTYFVNDHLQTSIEGPNNYPGGPLTRAQYGLPEDCFLFIMHNQVYKIDPSTFDVWARILNRVPGSKLWLLRFPPTAESRIREEARLRGLSPDRLVFTDVAAKEEHVARCGLGDLFLDTPTCNAHTTGTDALWSGIPLITCPGSLFASRVAASLLTAAGFPELIAHDMKAYEELAVDLATNRAKLAAIRTRLEQSRRTNPLFDTARWVRNVEQLYWQAWRRFESDQEPAHIFGRDVYESNLTPNEQEYQRGRLNRVGASGLSGFSLPNGISSLIAS